MNYANTSQVRSIVRPILGNALFSDKMRGKNTSVGFRQLGWQHSSTDDRVANLIRTAFAAQGFDNPVKFNGSYIRIVARYDEA